jgi:hypothetical protein
VELLNLFIISDNPLDLFADGSAAEAATAFAVRVVLAISNALLATRSLFNLCVEKMCTS